MRKDLNLAVVILAAGKSSRMQGITKQLLTYKKETLLKIATKKAMHISKNVFVVLGSNHTQCSKELENLDVTIVVNDNFELGLSSSIFAGINSSKLFANTLILLCDQPFITSWHLKKLILSHNSDNITASLYDDFCTVPAIFPHKFYDELLNIQGDKGAKEIIKKHGCKSIKLNKKFAIDIDTKEDINTYL